MSHDIKKTTDIKVEVALARDVEVIEMRAMSAPTHQDENPTTWAISAKKAAEDSKEPSDWIDGFRRADRRKIKGLNKQYLAEPNPNAGGDRYFDLQAANAKTATSALARELKGRHLQMIAFGGAIGTSVLELLVVHLSLTTVKVLDSLLRLAVLSMRAALEVSSYRISSSAHCNIVPCSRWPS